MKMSEALYQGMVEQVQAEFASAYLYLAMSLYFESLNLRGFARWMWIQYLEEQEHAHKFIHHLVDRGLPVPLKAIPAPPESWSSVKAVFEAGLEHEREVTRRIRRLYTLAQEGQDFASLAFLQHFLEEQVEEERIFEEVLADLERIGEDGTGLLWLDRELGRREPEEERHG